jgi:tight adherence protein B
MTSILLAAVAALGTALLVGAPRGRAEGRTSRRSRRGLASRCRRRAELALHQAGLESVSPRQFLVTVAAVGLAAAVAATFVVGPGPGAVLVGVLAGCWPVATWRRRRQSARRAAREQWPRLIEELRVLTGPIGRPVPQALLEVGLRGPEELRPAFTAAQREWALSTDFERTVAVLKERLADPTADATCETLLVVHEVGGDLDSRLAALAEDRRRDLQDRQEAEAKLAGARLARMFVLLVPAGMAVAGLNVGDGREAFRSPLGQALVVVGIALTGACWWWAGRLMRLPVEERVFDR